MTVVVITPPEPVVTFAEVAKHLADVPAEDQAYVEGLTAAATDWAAMWLRRAIGVHLLELQLADWPCDDFDLVRPMIEIESVTYVDPDGATHEWDFPPLPWSEGVPRVRGRPGDLRIRYWAGYCKREPDDEGNWITDVPAPIKVAIMMLVAQWYNTRENVITGTITSEMPFAVDALLQPFRVYR